MTALISLLPQERAHTIGYSLSGNPIVNRNNLRKNRPQFPAQLKHMIKIKDVTKHFDSTKNKQFIKKYGYTALKKINELMNLVSSGNNVYSEKISSLGEINEQYGRFWRRIRENYDFIVERDPSYLKWRYLDPRGGNYRLSVAAEDDELLGYIVSRVNRYRNYPEGYIVDLLAIPEKLEIAEALIIDSLNYFDNENVNTVNSLVFQGHPYEGLLKKHGFIKDRKKFYLFYSKKDPDFDYTVLEKSMPDKLHFMYGDLDWI
jgi:hypothetical protein